MRLGVVLFGSVWFGAVRQLRPCKVRYGPVWYCRVWFGEAVLVRRGSVRCGWFRSGVLGYVSWGQVWCCAV